MTLVMPHQHLHFARKSLFPRGVQVAVYRLPRDSMLALLFTCIAVSFLCGCVARNPCARLFWTCFPLDGDPGTPVNDSIRTCGIGTSLTLSD